MIEQDPSSHLGYERKYAALHGLENYGEAINAQIRMLSIIENSPEEEVRRTCFLYYPGRMHYSYTGLRANCTAPSEAIAVINAAIPGISGLCPRVLIDVEGGRLCDEQERIQMFKSGPFKKIVSETAMTKIDPAQIRQSVAKYFKWIMFSHTWGGKEPTLKDVDLVHSVWELDGSPLNEKLRQFCRTAHDDGYRWAWSDTCCIDKDASAILNQSLVSMYSWYENAAETLVYLADVPPSSEPGDLTLMNSRWMTRAWTLQELLASKVIRFYNRDWKLYLNDKHPNHKESPEIKQELAKAMGVAPETIRSFQPKDSSLGVREKLRLASTRSATVEEDIAYSLLGIFSSDIIPQYGLGKTALGQLLENIVDRTGDVTVISWTGQALPYNSALPDSLRVYSQGPYTLPPMAAIELDACVEQLRTQLVPQDALAFYHRVIRLPRATFRNRCLKLPCIMFTVLKIDKMQENLYRATVSSLGEVEFRTMDVMPRRQPWRLVFVYPWIPDLRELPGGSESDDEADAESDVGSSDRSEPDSDAGSGDGTDDASERVPPSDADPSAQVNSSSLVALRLIARLGRSFNALLLKEKSNRQQYRRVAAEHEIIVPGVPYKTNHSNIQVGELEVV